MKNDNFFIVLEGHDGAGKSTLVELLSKTFNAVHYQTPADHYQQIRSLVDVTADPIEHFLFYLAAVRYASEKIRHLLKNNTVICDRYIYTTLAYHRALGIEIEIDVGSLSLLEPDYIFFLQINPEEQKRRLQKKERQETAGDDYIVAQNIFERIDREFKRFPMHIINSMDNQPNELALEITRIITKGGQ